MSEARVEVFHSDDDDSCDTTSKWRLPNSWEWTSLSDVSELIFGQSPPSSTYNSEQRGLPFFQGKAEFGSAHPKVVKYCTAPTRTAEVGDILMSIRAPVGPTNVADRQCGVGRGLAAIRARGEIDPPFLLYFLNRTEAILAAQGTGTTFSAITKRVLVSHPVAIAPLKEQRRISSKIDELFSEIEAGERALKRARAALARYRKSVLKAAVTGDLTADWRAANKERLEPADKLLTRILAARREAWEKAERAKLEGQGKSPKGEEWRKKYREPRTVDDVPAWQIPDEWTWASPVELEANERNALTIGPFGSNLKVSDYRDSGVPLIFVRHIRLGDFDGHDPKFIDQKKAEELATHKARGGDIVITKMGDPPGDAAIYPKSAPDAIITADCIKWTTNCEAGEVAYFAMFINSALCAAQIADITKGVAQQKVSLDRFRGLAIALPPKDEQTEIVSRVEEAFSKADHVEAALDTQERAARALQQSILKAAFEGRLVPQDPADEPAAKLLERIKKAKGK